MPGHGEFGQRTEHYPGIAEVHKIVLWRQHVSKELKVVPRNSTFAIVNPGSLQVRTQRIHADAATCSGPSIKLALAVSKKAISGKGAGTETLALSSSQPRCLNAAGSSMAIQYFRPP